MFRERHETYAFPACERTFFAKEINSIGALFRTDCDSDSLAMELAKRIIDYERNEAFLISQMG